MLVCGIEGITSDLWGPSLLSGCNGFRYYVLIIDDFTRYGWIFPIQQKSEFFNVFVQYCKLVENQVQLTLKTIRTDGGGEFSSKIFASFLQQKGIFHQQTCPHTPEQNGVVERKHRHLVETGLTLLAQSSLPKSFWVETFHTALFLINRLPIVDANTTSPYLKLFDHAPDYSFLKVFGCKCFPWLRPYAATKLDFRSTECIFIGYSLNQKGYKCWCPSTGKVYLSRHVRFVEHVFPFSPTSSSNSISASCQSNPSSFADWVSSVVSKQPSVHTSSID